jgi:hypothetical protein
MAARAGKGAHEHHRPRLLAWLRFAEGHNVLLRLDNAILEYVLERCRFRKLDSSITVVEPAKDRIGHDVSMPLGRSCEGTILPQRNVRSHVIVIGGVSGKNSLKMLRVEHNQMIRALATD